MATTPNDEPAPGSETLTDLETLARELIATARQARASLAAVRLSA